MGWGFLGKIADRGLGLVSPILTAASETVGATADAVIGTGALTAELAVRGVDVVADSFLGVDEESLFAEGLDDLVDFTSGVRASSYGSFMDKVSGDGAPLDITNKDSKLRKGLNVSWNSVFGNEAEYQESQDELKRAYGVEGTSWDDSLFWQMTLGPTADSISDAAIGGVQGVSAEGVLEETLQNLVTEIIANKHDELLLAILGGKATVAAAKASFSAGTALLPPAMLLMNKIMLDNAMPDPALTDYYTNIPEYQELVDEETSPEVAPEETAEEDSAMEDDTPVDDDEVGNDDITEVSEPDAPMEPTEFIDGGEQFVPSIYREIEQVY